MTHSEALTSARRADSTARRARVLNALDALRREGLPINQRSVATRAGVHRNFVSKHRDLAALVANAQADYSTRAAQHGNTLSEASLRTDLALRDHELVVARNRIRALEARLSRTAMMEVPESDPRLVALQNRVAELDAQLVQQARQLRELAEENDALRETNRALARNAIAAAGNQP